MKNTLIKKQIGFLCIIAFVLHFVWENAQAPLFQGYVSFAQHLPSCFVGTIGDILFTLSIYLLLAIIKRNINWIKGLKNTDIIALAVIGFFLAIGIEQRALLAGKWSYNDLMPLVPFFQVGLSPILQMTILLPFSIYITKIKIYGKPQPPQADESFPTH